MLGWEIVLSVASGLCAVSGLAHLETARRRRRGGVHLWFGLTSLVVAVVGWITVGSYDPGEPVAALRSVSLCVVFFLGAAVVMAVLLAAEMSDRSRLARETARHERRWRALLDNLDLAVVAYDATGTIVYVNPYVVDASGFPEERFIGGRVGVGIAARDRDRFERALDDAFAGVRVPVLEVATVIASGDERLVSWSTVVLKDELGRPVEFIAVGVDVTDRRDAERNRDHLRRELDRLAVLLAEQNLTLVREPAVATQVAGIVGESRPLVEALDKVRQVAATETAVLLLGETGTGKELLARAVHAASRRSDGPFVTVNCGGLPPTLVESELFGHERGAFTGAERTRQGRFGQADGGTIFLDEVGELPLELQPKLLRVLQSGEFERVGGDRTFTAHVRVVAATHRDLEAEVRAGRFREDLFYRLNVFPIVVPPLRRRRDDIPLLVEHFVPILAKRADRTIDEVPGSVLRQLMDYAWPGNVRELISVLERAVVTSEDGVLRLSEPLDPGVSARLAEGSEAADAEPLITLEENERRHILRALESCGGKISGAGGAAELLGINPSTLRTRMKKLGLHT